MIRELSITMTAITYEEQQIETLKIKLNEAIRHISNLEEKLLSPEDLLE